MNYTQYKELFDEILSAAQPPAPYNEDLYLNYTTLNSFRMKRWDKQLALDEELASTLREIATRQHWIIITEPWCGDAAHIVPFLIRMTEQSERLTYDIQLRDSEPFLIDSYLTNGSKSIPKLIVCDEAGSELFNWGPRPKGAQELMETMKAAHAGFETTKIALQNWYNKDKGESLFKELSKLLNACSCSIDV